MYKVFFNNKEVLITDNYDLSRICSGELFLHYDDFEELGYVTSLLEESEFVTKIVIESDDIEVLWSDFRALFGEIDAAGGIVVNDKNELLLIYRNGLWDLPKGKRESDESIEECALREVEEECGIHDLIVKEKRIVSYHSYLHNDSRILKHTHWYAMKSEQKDLRPQKEEGITDVKWIPIENFNTDDYPTYKSIAMVINHFAKATTGLL